ncbi:MAG: transposase [Chloroflexota bacterium]
MQPAVLGAETALELGLEQRNRTIYRLDGGAGTDEKLRWLVERGYHFIAKGFSGKRAYALAQQVSRWDRYDDTSWLGAVQSPIDFGYPVQMMVKRCLQKDQWKHSYYVSTLAFSSKQAFMARYNLRGAAEIEQFREDKNGLHLSARRKQSFAAQQAIILHTDLVHNLLADFRHCALAHSRFQNWGLKRIVRDLLAIPARLYFHRAQLNRIELLDAHPYSQELIICLEKYCSRDFGQ